MVGVEYVMDYILQRVGNLEQVYLTGQLASGQNSDIIDLILVGKNLNRAFLLEQIEKAEKKINKKIRHIIYLPEEFDESKLKDLGAKPLLLWSI